MTGWLYKFASRSRPKFVVVGVIDTYNFGETTCTCCKKIVPKGQYFLSLHYTFIRVVNYKPKYVTWDNNDNPVYLDKDQNKLTKYNKENYYRLCPVCALEKDSFSVKIRAKYAYLINHHLNEAFLLYKELITRDTLSKL